MTATSARDLLFLAVQDLHDGELAWQERAEELRAHVSDPGLAQFSEKQTEHAAHQSARLEEAARTLDVAAQDARNIWLRAVLDDARRDTEMIARGALLDTAL